MAKPVSPPRSPRGSPLVRRHPSPSADRYSAIYSAPQRLPERSNIHLVAAAAAAPTPGVPSPIYSNTSSPISPEVASYPALYHDRPQPPHGVSASATMPPSSAMARNNNMSFDLGPTSTPTGRVSKAKKGKRVHACDFPGCGKVFTRAEHKRRHELNHNPDATFQCSHPGCDKSFHRNDLLQRHQDRHDMEASNASPNHRRHPSQTSAFSEPPSAMPPSNMTSPPVSESVPRSSGGMSIGSLLQTPTSTYATDMSSGLVIQGVPYLPWTTGGEEPMYFAPEHSPLQGRYLHRHQSISSASSVADFTLGSSSPMVTASMTTNWMPASAPPNNLPSSMFGEGYATSTAAVPIPLSDMDGYEWSVIRRELSSVPGLLSSPCRAGLSDTIRWHCLDLYWQCFHPTFPIVHKPTFLPAKPSPLLACAMVAIGSFYDQQEDSKTYSLSLIEIATKILSRRDNITSRSRIADLQTVVLLEVLSTFCARQISVQMSTRFRALFANLNQARHWLTTSPLAVFRTLKPTHSPAELAKAHKFFVEHETRSRILHACSVLDNQQATLFEQSPTVRRHNALRINTAALNNTTSINLPCDDELWDASPVEKWAELARVHDYKKIAPGRPASPKATQDLSFFQNQVSCSNATQSPTKSPPMTQARIGDFAPVLSKTGFNEHVAQMCKYTPIRNLLTVTGSSWLLGRKIEKEASFTQAKQDLRKWLDNSTAAKRGIADAVMAHWHALKLLRGLAQLKQHVTDNAAGEVFGSTNMMHENWSIYLACLVCWAHSRRRGLISMSNGLVHDGDQHPTDGNSFLNSIPASVIADPHLAANEARTYLTFTDVSTPGALRDLDSSTLSRIHGLLETVRNQKIASCMMGGLMNDAEQVLFKLVEDKTRIDF